MDPWVSFVIGIVLGGLAIWFWGGQVQELLLGIAAAA